MRSDTAVIATPTPRADYGLDAPGVMRNYGLGGVALLALAAWLSGGESRWLRAIELVSFAGGVYCLGYCAAMNLYSRIGKFYQRDRMLDLVRWTGKETALDIGTGRGLLMIGAAKRIATGRAYGVDVWIEGDLSSNSYENAMRNASAEGVGHKVEVRNDDARRLSFADGSIDVVLSLLCLHNICDERGKFDSEGRRQACREIARVLKPGGRAVISDAWHTEQYAQALQEAGLEVTRSAPLYFKTFPALRIVVATKR